MPLEHIDQPNLGLVKLPARGDKAAVLVAVGIAEHHFLLAAARLHQAAVFRQRQGAVHHGGAVAQILNRLEQRHDVHRAAAFRRNQPGFLQQHGDLEQVGDALAL